MKNIIIIFILIGTSFIANAQNSTLIINSEVKIDSTGNAVFEMSGKLTGQQWNLWNSIYGGGNALMVKKQIERTLSQFYVYDFRYSPNEMERTFTIQYKAKGIVKYLGKDKWLAEMGLKENKPTKIGENSCNFVTSQLAGSTVIQTNGVVTFPAQTKNMTFDKDEFNNIVIKYEMPTESITKLGESGTKNLGYSLLGLSALTLAGLVFFRKKLA
jgi:LPXTG-motif cell wall-anchored protein